MPKSRQLTTRPTGLLAAFQTNRSAKEVATLQEEAFIARTHDAILRDLTSLKMADIGNLTRQGIDESADIVSRLTAHAETNPLAAQAASRIAETGLRGLDGRLRHFLKEG